MNKTELFNARYADLLNEISRCIRHSDEQISTKIILNIKELAENVICEEKEEIDRILAQKEFLREHIDDIKFR